MKEIRAGRKSIYVPDSRHSALYRLLSMRGDDAVSHTLETAIERYLMVIGHSLPNLSPEEWCLVLDSQLGVFLDDETGVQLVGETTVESMEIDSLDQKWGVDAGRMREIMADLTYAEKQAVCEFIELFRADDTGESYTEIISRVQTLLCPYPSKDIVQATQRMSPDRLGT